MYRIEDNASAIKALQKLLGINQTGNYDKATRLAVIKIQEAYSLKKSAVADYKTFKAILEEYRNNQKKVWNSELLFAPLFPYREGDMGDNVRRINESLSNILSNYRYEEALPRGAYFGKSTTDSVRFLQRIFLMQDSGIVDAVFMNRILSEMEGLAIKRKYR